MTINEFNKESTIDNPLGFFEYFFLRGGFHQLHKGFFLFVFEHGEFEGEAIFNEPIIEVNREQEYFVISDSNNDDGIVYERKHFFKDELKSHLLNEARNTKRLINERIQSLNLNEKKVVFFLKDITSSLKNLSINIRSNPQQSKYIINTEITYFIIEPLLNRYNLFFSKIDSPFIQEASEYFLNKKEDEKVQGMAISMGMLDLENKKARKSISELRWVSNIVENTLILYKILTENGVIPEDGDTLENLRIALNGGQIIEPLKIKWKLMKDGKHTKPTLIRAIKYILMDELKVVEEIDNSHLAKALNMIFVDGNGNQMDNLINGLSTMSHKVCGPIENKLHQELRTAQFLVNHAIIS